jgi:ABC-2 type transport system permease protein
VDYFGYVSIVLALFCAVAAPEIIGRDQRTRTLSLYFSRALSRLDYALAKLLALYLALFLVVLTPQLILLLGEAVAATDLVDSLRDNADQLPAIVAGSALVAVLMGSIALAVACQTSRRAFATGAVLGFFVLMTVLGAILFETLTGSARDWSRLISPVGVLEGSMFWLFGIAPDPGSELEQQGLSLVVFFLAACVQSAVAIAVFLRKLQKVTV